MTLFKGNLVNRKTLAAGLVREPEPSADQAAAAAYWAAEARGGFGGRSEVQIEQAFNQYVLRGILGYVEESVAGPGTMRAKQAIGPGAVDVALGRFAGPLATVAAPLELKGPKTDLDRIMPGRAKTPVQQAWEYAVDAPGARWVLVANMTLLRLYAFGQGRTVYEEFDLRRIDTPADLKRLILLVHAANLLGTATADLLARSAREDRDITDQLYRDYRDLRRALLHFVADQRPAIAAEARIALVQKILDRLVFIAYAEDTILMPDHGLRDAIERDDPYYPRPKWDNLKVLFAAVDTGNARLGITGYNGGLFAPDPLVDGIALPDHLVLRFVELTKYDFTSEISVTILGHLFEQTIGDIEQDLLHARGQALPATTKKKRDGIVYTPDFVTRFIVDQTLGRTIAELRADLLAAHVEATGPDGDIVWRGDEAAFWRALLDRLRALRVVDPACGSGHFLVAAFDHLSAVTKEANDRLRELASFDAIDTAAANTWIITKNLFGVDLNAESVEITRLSLWLRTAQPRQPLTTLDQNIRVGNSIIADAGVDPRAFAWDDDFARGGFDVVLGNPPYVRMELLRPIKPYLAAHYAVAADRADLYAYFFELGVELLRPGGRLGFISSATFFRTGSGAALREWLAAAVDVEAVVDFGDAQLFAGVTTYPAILTMRKREPLAQPGGDLRYLTLNTVPDDLAKAFDGAQAMPRARLMRSGWRFEGDRLADLRARMAAGRSTLAEVYGAPLRGIVTGLNEAFVVDRPRRDALIAADSRSAELLKPFLIGENLKRWHVASDDLWLIYTPKNRVQIDDFPAIRDHLLPFRAALEARATKQNWWELQQAQAAYEGAFAGRKLIWPHFQNASAMSIDASGSLLNNKAFFIANACDADCAILNSAPMWALLTHVARAKRGGYIEAEAQYVGTLPRVAAGAAEAPLAATAVAAADASDHLLSLVRTVHARLADLDPRIAHIAAFAAWPKLSFADLRALLAKRLKIDVPVGERDAWDRYLADKRAEAAALAATIADGESEIDDRVYHLFDLSHDDIALIADSIGRRA